MAQPEVAPYGSWKSPITSDLVSGTIATDEPEWGLGEIALDGKDVYFVELRPAEGGRRVIVRHTSDGKSTDVTPPGFDASTRVQEYGGGAFAVSGGTVYFCNFDDQRLYRQERGAQPRPITAEADLRCADGVIDGRRGRMVCVREDHSVAGREAVTALVSVDLEGGSAGEVLVSGNDFYSSPRLSADGSRLAWLTWNHPNMPWDGTELWVGELTAGGSLGKSEQVAGGVAESIFQPEWSPDGRLYFVSDRTGWSNLYRWHHGRIEALCEMEAEFALPQWLLGLSLYSFESADLIACVYIERGVRRLALLNTARRELEVIETPYSEVWSVQAAPGRIVFGAGSPVDPASIVELDLHSRQLKVLHRSTELTVGEEYLALPQAIEFQTDHGLTAYAFFYAPQNAEYAAPRGERPPLLVISHGGPTFGTWTTLRLDIHYWTSRGFAVLDVDYGGSTGYGREYRQRLEGQWGVVDLNDCVNGARYLVERGIVDGDRIAIRGASAGGYTTLCAAAFRDFFNAGASYYGISDLETWTKETHKFESHYLDRLIGPYPERRDLYQERSPINSIDRVSCPVILFQGLEDKMVPPNQAELMVKALRSKGLPVAYLPFEGEHHGFVRAESIKRALDAELYFYSRIFDFQLADPIEPVSIANL